jgi:hypothetical protein
LIENRRVVEWQEISKKRDGVDHSNKERRKTIFIAYRK